MVLTGLPRDFQMVLCATPRSVSPGALCESATAVYQCSRGVCCIGSAPFCTVSACSTVDRTCSCLVAADVLRPFVQGADCCRVGCHRLLVALRSRALVAAEAVCARSGLLPLYAATMAIGWRSAVAPPPPPASRDRVMRTHNTLNVVTHINARLLKGFVLIRIGRVTHHPLDLT